MKIILNKFDNFDDVKKLALNGLISRKPYIDGNPKNRKIILDRFDDIDDIKDKVGEKDE